MQGWCLILVLSRKLNETIRIGDNVRVTIVDIRGDRIRIGIDAPKDVAVHRDEVYQAILLEKQSQATTEEPGNGEVA